LTVVAFLLLGYECAARRSQALYDRPGTMLLSVFSLTMVVGAAWGFRNFSVLFVVLAGLLAWLAQELYAMGRTPSAF